MKRLLAAQATAARFADAKQRFAQLETEWEESRHRNKQALRGMLLIYRFVLPEVLFTALIEELDSRRPLHRVRYEMVVAELAQNPKPTVWEATQRASRKLAKTPARGKRGAVERSYYLVKPKNAS